MAKEAVAQIKLYVPAGQANPAPPVGPALGQHGVNIMDFCKQFNERTKAMEQGMIIPAVITVFDDRSFTFITKMPPVSSLLKKAAGLAKVFPGVHFGQNGNDQGKLVPGQDHPWDHGIHRRRTKPDAHFR